MIVPVLTPFDAQGKLDTGALAALVEYLIERGVHGLQAHVHAPHMLFQGEA